MPPHTLILWVHVFFLCQGDHFPFTISVFEGRHACSSCSGREFYFFALCLWSYSTALTCPCCLGSHWNAAQPHRIGSLSLMQPVQLLQLSSILPTKGGTCLITQRCSRIKSHSQRGTYIRSFQGLSQDHLHIHLVPVRASRQPHHRLTIRGDGNAMRSELPFDNFFISGMNRRRAPREWCSADRWTWSPTSDQW